MRQRFGIGTSRCLQGGVAGDFGPFLGGLARTVPKRTPPFLAVCYVQIIVSKLVITDS